MTFNRGTDRQTDSSAVAQIPQRCRESEVITPVKVIQSHLFWYQSKPHMRLPISK